MECKFAVICKLYVPAGPACRVPWNKGLTKDSDHRMKKISEEIKAGRAGQVGILKDAPSAGIPKRAYKARVKKETRPSVTLRHCKKCDFTVDTGNEGKNKSAILAHFWKEHSKNAAGGKKEKKTAAGKVPKESANNKEAEQAFKDLKQRANKGKLTAQESVAYDNLEPEIIGLPAEKWPDGSREAVIKLYNEVRKEEEN